MVTRVIALDAVELVYAAIADHEDVDDTCRCVF